MGNVKQTAQNLEVVRVDPDRNLVLVKGSVPGAPGGTLIVKAAVKSGRGLGSRRWNCYCAKPGKSGQAG